MLIVKGIKAVGKGIGFLIRHKNEAVIVKDAVEKGIKIAKEYKDKQPPKIEYIIHFTELNEGDYPFFSAQLDKRHIKFACNKPQNGEIRGEISKVFKSLKRAQLFKARLPKMLAEYEIRPLKQDAETQNHE